MDAPQGSPMMSMPEKKAGNAGSVIAIILIVLVLAVGGIYYFMSTAGELGMNSDDTSLPADSQTEALAQQSSSDEFSSIEADVQATNLNGLNEGSGELQVQ